MRMSASVQEAIAKVKNSAEMPITKWQQISGHLLEAGLLYQHCIAWSQDTGDSPLVGNRTPGRGHAVSAQCQQGAWSYDDPDLCTAALVTEFSVCPVFMLLEPPF